MKGAEIIAQYLVKQKVPYVFGICGHGNVGMLDALYDVSDKVKLVSPFNARLKYNALAAFRILAAHQRRHLWQAERALESARWRAEPTPSPN